MTEYADRGERKGTARLHEKRGKGEFRRATTAKRLFGAPAETRTNEGGIVPDSGRSDAAGDRRPRMRVKPVRLGKRWTQIISEIDDGLYTWNDLVQTLSPEELARGQLADKDGRFRGRPSSLVPRAFHDACIRELMKRGQVLYKSNYVDAIETMTQIALGNVPGSKPADRMKAAQFVIERLEGRAVERVVVTGEDPFSAMLEGAVASVEEDAAIANAQDYLDRKAAADSGTEATQ